MRVLIIGARQDGQGKVVLEILQSMPGMEVVGFLDDDPRKQSLVMRGVPVLGPTSALRDVARSVDAEGAIGAFADNVNRRGVGELIERSGLILINAIHPTAHRDSDVKLGSGVVLCPRTCIIAGSTIGDCVNIHTAATVDHDNVIEEGANLGPGVHTAGRVRIGRDSMIGTGAVVIPGVTVGAGAIIGAGAVVIRDVPPHKTFCGVPARAIEKKGNV